MGSVWPQCCFSCYLIVISLHLNSHRQLAANVFDRVGLEENRARLQNAVRGLHA